MTVRVGGGESVWRERRRAVEVAHLDHAPPHLAMGTERNLVIEVAEDKVMATPSALHQEDIAQIVHDLKTPLATIGLEVELLREELAETAPAASALGRITHTVAALADKVNEILDLAAMEADRFTLHRLPTELRGMLEDVLDRAVAPHDQPRVLLEARARTIAAIDDARLQRVVATLVRHALADSPRGAGIVVRLDATPATARISVIAAGPGMTSAEVASLFDPRHHGGVALHVSKRIVEAHGGRLGVETVRGTGTRFFFELPIEQT